jgi:hypothetical protein
MQLPEIYKNTDAWPGGKVILIMKLAVETIMEFGFDKNSCSLKFDIGAVRTQAFPVRFLFAPSGNNFLDGIYTKIFRFFVGINILKRMKSFVCVIPIAYLAGDFIF